jgi:hypothetical protein
VPNISAVPKTALAAEKKKPEAVNQTKLDQGNTAKGPDENSLNSTASIDIPAHATKPGAKMVRKERSNTVLATITTVIKMEDPKSSHSRGHGRRTSTDSRITTISSNGAQLTKQGETRSRVSLVPEASDQLTLSIVSAEEDEYLSAGDGELETISSQDESDGPVPAEDSREKTKRGIDWAKVGRS